MSTVGSGAQVPVALLPNCFPLPDVSFATVWLYEAVRAAAR